MNNTQSFKPSDVKIGILGGDRRQLSAARAFAEDGYETAVFGLSAAPAPLGDATKCGCLESVLRGADLLLLPLPYTKDSVHLNCPMCLSPLPLETMFAAAAATGTPTVYGGLLDKKAYDIANKHGLPIYDYYRFEELCIKNAAATAEGAIAVAISAAERMLCGSEVLVGGFGRIGRQLAARLSALGAKVTVTARKTVDLAKVATMGCTPLPLTALEQTPLAFSLIFNTVPYPIFTEAAVHNMANHTVYIELASAPGGIDMAAAEAKGLVTVAAPSLPGKYLPISAGQFIKEAVETHYRQLCRERRSNESL